MSGSKQSSLPIEDYALIGNLRCCALVSKAGSIDWYCPHKFDAPACFAALLGSKDNGRWLIAPQDKPVKVQRQYLKDTLILETTFSTAGGEVSLTDFMPVDCHNHIVRIVRGVSGTVRMRTECNPRFNYGKETPAMDQRRTVVFSHEQGHLILAADVPVQAEDNAVAQAEFDIEAGQERSFVLSFTKEDRTARAPMVNEALQSCLQWWREWSGSCGYDGPWRDEVIRSLITLKALIYEPTGGMVAAATTSLPEIPGGWANWDYRYCWLRDAALVLDVFLRRNRRREAIAWRDWLMDAASHPEAVLHSLYTIDGSEVDEEQELPWLAGYDGATPVRIGNGARTQFQIDLRGELLDVLHLARLSGLDAHDSIWELQCRLLAHLDQTWNKPDAGIWEFREDGLQLTHSKVLAWVAYDRTIKDAQANGLKGPLEHWKQMRETIREDILKNGVHPQGNYFTQQYGGTETDASLLQVSEMGFLPADDPRMLATVKKIEEDLLIDGLVYRYKTDDYREGAFLPCSLWLANNYQLSGRCQDAEKLFKKVLSLCNDVGLLSEEYDPVSQRLLGNFPQSFTHLELINTAELIGAGEQVYRSGGE